MLLFSPLFLTAFAALPQDPPQEEPAPEAEVSQEAEEPTPEQARELLETAVKSKQLDLIFAAIEETGRIADAKLVKQLGDLLKHKDGEVRRLSLQALRYNKHEDSLDALLKHKKNKAILEDELAAEQYYFALGQKGDKKALKVLTDGLSKTNRGDKVTRARILALGRIRDTDSVEALIDVMVSGSLRRRHPQLTEIHTSLSVLTGADVAMNQDAWIAWWNDNKKGLKLTEQEQELATRKGRAAWMTVWATPEDQELMKLAQKKGKDGFGDATQEELDELRKKAEEKKRRKEEAEGDKGDGSDKPKGDGSDKPDGDGR
jgi:HEAT repeat protein